MQFPRPNTPNPLVKPSIISNIEYRISNIEYLVILQSAPTRTSCRIRITPDSSPPAIP